MATQKNTPVPMETAADKTSSLQRIDVPIDSLIPNDLNPNEMGESEFNMLYDNIEKMGVTDPILVRNHPDFPDKYRIVGGHHRWEVAKLHGLEKVPCTVITDPSFDDDMEKFQVVRHNVIRGKMSPQKFAKLYESLAGKYAKEIAAEMFGFSDQDEFEKLVASTAKSLPKEMQQAFKDAAKEIKTIDGLANLLNRMFTDYGDTLPYGFMIFDYGNNDNIWLRMEKKQKSHFLQFAELCKGVGCSVDGAMSLLLQLIAKGPITKEMLLEGMDALPKVDGGYEVPVNTANLDTEM